MEGFKVAKILMGLLVLGIIDIAVLQTIKEDIIPEEPIQVAGTEAEEYEIIPIHKSRLQKRDLYGRTQITLKAFGDHIKLWLEPKTGILATEETPVYTIDLTGKLIRHADIMKRVVNKLYQDEGQAATLVINELVNGDVELNGIVGAKGLAIRSVPDNYNVRRQRRSIDNIPESEIGNYTYHIVSRLPKVPDHLKTLKAPLTASRSKRAISDTIYPEIMVIMDYSLFEKWQNSYYLAVGYLLAFWNGVDLKYRSLQNPKYRLNIAGIIIATQPDSLEYMRYKLTKYPGDLLVEEALPASGPWLAGLEKFLKNSNNFDAAITMTSTPFCKVKNNVCGRGCLGLAYVSGACRQPIIRWDGRRNVPVNGFKSAIVYDQSSFDGINVAAHELGHLLGSGHDGEDHRECHAGVGNLMAPTISYTANASDWSYCSVRDFQKFLNSHEPTCLYNIPKLGTKISRFLPGQILDANQQCKKLGNERAYYVDDGICVELKCLRNNGRWVQAYPGAADGTPCGNKKICLHRQCMHLSQITY